MVAIEFLDWVVIFFYSAVCIIFLLIGIIFLLKSRDKQKNIRNYLLGIGIFFLLYGISRAMMFLFEATFPIVANSLTGGIIEPNFIWNLNSAEVNLIFETYAEINLYHELIWRVTTALGTGGLIFLLYELEIHILEKRSKFLFTIIETISVLPALIIGLAGTQKDEVAWVRIILYVGNVIMIVVPLIYFWLGAKTSGDTRKRAIGAGISMLIMFFGVVFNSSIGKTLFPGLFFPYIMYGIFVIIGTIAFMKTIQY